MSSTPKSNPNRYYTLLIVPEKTDRVRRIVIPQWVVRTAGVSLAFLTLTALVMLFDYGYVMSQVGENKQLKMENRRLRQQVQIFKNKVTTVESTLDRIRTFATRLRVITNLEERGNFSTGGPSQSTLYPDGKLPDANTNVGTSERPKTSEAPSKPSESTEARSTSQRNALTPISWLGSSLNQKLTSFEAGKDPEESQLQKEYDQLDERFSELTFQSLGLEQMLQDQYEQLADQKAFLAALPTRKPAVGYFTSGFGVRRSPTDGTVRMHEGLDIANRPGTPIKSPADGTVLFSDAKSGYGQVLVIDHGYGLTTWYGHVRKRLVNKGQRIRRGELIALLGNSGRSTGPHLHYEVRVHGTPVDPLSYILEN
jgi:murein DD-endopeptidase MepM/ murein hydrolase activator NlpD